MNKKLLPLGLVALIIALGGGTYFLLQKNTKPTATNQSAVQKPAPKGAYVTYKPGLVAVTKGPKILFFHDPANAECHALDTDIQKNGTPYGISIIKVDYETSADLRQKYGITTPATLVKVDDQGELVKTHVATANPSLSVVLKDLL